MGRPGGCGAGAFQAAVCPRSISNAQTRTDWCVKFGCNFWRWLPSRVGVCEHRLCACSLVVVLGRSRPKTQNTTKINRIGPGSKFRRACVGPSISSMSSTSSGGSGSDGASSSYSDSESEGVQSSIGGGGWWRGGGEGVAGASVYFRGGPSSGSCITLSGSCPSDWVV